MLLLEEFFDLELGLSLQKILFAALGGQLFLLISFVKIRIGSSSLGLTSVDSWRPNRLPMPRF